ncbi:MAG: helicase HerA domain-containing protein [Limisphaerales bacterium]
MNLFFFDEGTPLVRLECYEPAGLRLELNASSLFRHLLLIGGTGAGKTSVLNVMLGQLLAARVGGQPIGLLILDGKQDHTVLRIEKLAAEAGRSVQVLTPGGVLGYDLFSSLLTLDDVAVMAQRLVLGAGPLGGDIAYWENMRTTMLEAALSLLVVRGTPVAFDSAIEFMRTCFFDSEDPAPVNDLVQHAGSVLAANRLPAPITRRIKQSLDAVKLWGKLDGRTRSNVQSILLTVLNPLLSSRAGLLFAAQGRPTFLPEVVVNQGGVVVVSINALTEPALARLVFRLVKNDFYECAQRRLAGPLCGLIMDENPLAASLDDLENLQTLRSRGAFVIAATQGFLALDQMVGVRIRQALVAGFQNIIAMQSHEPEVDLLMAIIMGEPRIVEPPPVLCLIQDDFAAGFVRVRHNSRDSQNLQTLNPPVVHDLHRHPAMLMLVLFNGSFFDAG